MKPRLALWLHKLSHQLLNLSDRLLEPTPPTLYDDGEDPRDWGESPV